MKNSDIKYNLSKDYDRLHKLLKEGNTIIGFVPIVINGENSHEYSKLVELRYNSDKKSYHIGFTFFEKNLKQMSFAELCEEENIRFIDL